MDQIPLSMYEAILAELKSIRKAVEAKKFPLMQWEIPKEPEKMGNAHLDMPIKPLPVPKLIYTIHDDVSVPVYWDGKVMSFTGYFRIDDDGPGSAHNDPYHQGQTSLKHNGQSINADDVEYGVIPMSLIPLVVPKFIGCQGYCTHNGLRVPFVTADAGPITRGGEGSVKLASRFPGVSTDANNGGVNLAVVLWEFLPGVPALVNGIQYQLQTA